MLESKNRGVHQDSFVKLAKAREINLDGGVFVIIPRGAEHGLVADGGAYFLLFVRKTTMITRKFRNERRLLGPPGFEVGTLLALSTTI